MGGGDTVIATEEQRLGALRIQSSSFGLPIPIVFGKARIACNLIWYGDFKSIAHTTEQSSGGKGGGEVTQTSTTYTYETAVAIGICEGPITEIKDIWAGKSRYKEYTIKKAQENFVVPISAPYQVTVAHAATFNTNISASGKGVFYFPMTQGVDYSVSAGVYTFSASHAGRPVVITYKYTAPPTSALSILGLSIFSGTYSQTPWSHLTTHHPTQAINYRGLAYVANASYQLGRSANLPNHSFEVVGFHPFSASIRDANPKDIASSFLTNQDWGVLFPSAKLASLTDYSNYCVSHGLFVSPSLTEQRPANEFFSELMQATNSATVWSEGLLKIIPYGDSAKTANGATYTPSITPQYDLTDGDFIVKASEDPVRVMRRAPADAYNQVQIEFANRANEYNIEPVEAKDQANIEMFGLRPMRPLKMNMICDPATAKTIAQLILQRALYIRNEYEFTLGWKYCRLEPMDIVTITDALLGLDKKQIRIVEVEEDEDGDLLIRAEEFPFGVASNALYQNQLSDGYTVDYNASVGDINPPLIIDSPGVRTVSGYEVWMALSNTDPNYGGCEIHVSLDDASYKRVGTLYGSSRHGYLTAAFPIGSDPDVTNICKVDLSISGGNLTGGTQGDADLNNLLSYVNGELISFQTATLTAANKYDLEDYIRRGVYNTLIQSHALGAPFARLDDAMFRYEYESSMVGKEIYLKFLTFNRYGGGFQSLDDVAAYRFLIGGSISAPSNVTGFTVSQNGNVAVFQWDIIPVLQEPNISGYEIRFNPVGDSSWNNGSELTKVTRGTQITTAKVPPGVWNFMICARDDSGVYSRIPAEFVMEMTNTNTIIIAPSQNSDWLGTISNFVRHCSGVLIPESTKGADELTKEELWEQFVPYPAAICTYTTPEIDVGFDSEVRLHGEIISLLGRGVLTGIAAPYLEMDYRLAAGSFDGFEDWTIGYVTCRYFKMKLTLETAIGNAYIKEFTPTADSGDKAEEILNQVIAAGGTVVNYPIQYHNKPNIQVTVFGTTGLTATIDPASITTTSCKIHVFNSSGTNVGGTVNIFIVGV